jgi:hypothetical protein
MSSKLLELDGDSPEPSPELLSHRHASPASPQIHHSIQAKYYDEYKKIYQTSFKLKQ